jgi:hypothetical protein
MRERDKTRANMKDEGEGKIYKRRGRKRDQKDR